MNCQEFQEYISAGVDSRLEAKIRKSFEEHLHTCSLCRSQFELELMTKRVLQQELTFQPTPLAVSDRVRSQITRLAGQETNPSSQNWASWILRISSRAGFRTALATGLIAVVALILFVSLPIRTHHLHTSPDDNNIVHQSLNNFDAVVAGTLRPQLASNNPTDVQKFFAKKVDYKVRVPFMKNCTLMGGLVSAYQGKPLAHVVYRHDGEVIYLYQVDIQTVLEGKALTIPVEAKEELLRTGWYTLSKNPKCSLVMWLVDSTLCTAVADIDKRELIAYLTYSDEKE